MLGALSQASMSTSPISGEGELSEDRTETGDAPASSLAPRRGGQSIRERNIAALSDAAFPHYPEDPPPEEAFALPPGFIDADAPVSARKWYTCAASRRSNRRRRAFSGAHLLLQGGARKGGLIVSSHPHAAACPAV